MLSDIEKYYNKFNEDKRLDSRHGRVEFNTSMHFISKYAKRFKNAKVIDIGAGTGKYSIALKKMGCDVTAVELVKHNLRVIEQKDKTIKAFQGNALNLKKIADGQFDITILFGPMYHLFSTKDKIKALQEAKRVTKVGGIIFVAYYMNDYAIIKHGFVDGNIEKSFADNLVDKNFKILPNPSGLYSMERIEDIRSYSKQCNLKRLFMFAPDGASDYIRKSLNAMDKKTFDLFLKYQLSICKRKEMLGASSHIVDVLKKEN